VKKHLVIAMIIMCICFFVFLMITSNQNKDEQTALWTYRLNDDLESFLIVSYLGEEEEITLEEEYQGRPIVAFHEDFVLPSHVKKLTLSINLLFLDIDYSVYRPKTELVVPEDSKLQEYSCNFRFYMFINESIYIPKHANLCVHSFIDNLTVKEIIVHPENPYYQSLEGILYNKDLTEIVYFPARHPFESYTVLPSVTTIKERTFFTQLNLRTLYIPQSVIKIEHFAFAYSYIENIVFLDHPSISDLGFMSLSHTYNLKNFHVPDSVTRLRGTFKDSSVREITFGVDSMLSIIDEGTFWGTRNLKTLELPRHVNTIKGKLFVNSGIEHLKIQSILTEISNDSFQGMSKLIKLDFILPQTLLKYANGVLTFNEGKEIVLFIPNETGEALLYVDEFVETINFSAIHRINALHNIEVSLINQNFSSVEGVLYSKDLKTLVLYPFSHERESYQILEGTERIIFSFAHTTHLKELTIPESLEILPLYAFASSSIEKITFLGQSNITEIPDFAFYDSNILEITIPKSIISIKSSAFKRSELKHLYFEEGTSLVIIGDYAFSETKIKNIILPKKDVFIDRYAFSKTELENVYIPIEVINIHQDAFKYNYNITFFLEHLNMPNTINLPTTQVSFLYGKSINDYLQSIGND
jgi:hypothetical protein